MDRPTQLMATAALVASLVVTLLSSLLYTARGWDDPTAATLHLVGGVLGAIGVLRLAAWCGPRLAAAVVGLGLAGACGVVGYGFNTVAVGLGGLDLIDASGPGVVLLKVLGVLWPLTFVLVAVALLRSGGAVVLAGVLMLAGAVAFPVSRIANIGWLAVVCDALLLAGVVGALRTGGLRRSRAERASERDRQEVPA